MSEGRPTPPTPTGNTGTALSDAVARRTDERVPQPTVHNGSLEPLLDRGGHAHQPTELVIAPNDLHQRTLKQRFARARQPRDTIRCVSPIDIATELQTASQNNPPELLDRVDRLPLLEHLLEETDAPAARLTRVLGVAPRENVDQVEQARNTIETITGYHPTRVAAIREWCTQHDAPAANDCRDLLEGVLGMEQELRARTDEMTSQGALVRKACQRILTQEGQSWDTAFPTIERLWLCGISIPAASLLDLVAAVGRATDVDLHLHVRPVSGTLIRDRLPELLAVPQPGQEVFAE